MRNVFLSYPNAEVLLESMMFLNENHDVSSHLWNLGISNIEGLKVDELIHIATDMGPGITYVKASCLVEISQKELM